MKIKNNKIENIKKKAIDFICHHPDAYNRMEKEYLISFIKSSSYPELFYTEFIREILDEMSLIPIEYNIYHDYANLINMIHGIDDRNITEIGGGRFPRLAHEMRLRQQKGTITVYDPKLYVTNSTDRLVLKKELVTKDTELNESDLIVGLMPCEGAEVLLNLALKNKTDFILWLCEGGPHGDVYDFYEDDKEWRDSMIIMAKRGVEKNNMGKLMIKKHEKYFPDYPIIYNTKRVEE